MKHINCLPFYGIFQGNDNVPYLVSPWMERGDLSDYLIRNPDVDRLPLVSALAYCGTNTHGLGQIYDIASGLEYLHKMQPTIVHGDLKCVSDFMHSNDFISNC